LNWPCLLPQLAQQIVQIHQASRQTYGSLRIQVALARTGHAHGRRRIARLVRQEGLWGRVKGRFRVRTTDSRHDQPIASMSRKANCYDNAAMESFGSTLKHELIYRRHFTTRAEARQAIFEFIEVSYNRQRLHSSLGYRSPIDFEDHKN
jgi:transposase InsO family protein